ncbi:hypothetical protein BKA56DRAFT_609576 [Ilyonectria sp. MPI-CAGE-AT-0026]|nr:hypothetical protein BKA56DRAFT_609576 [Ilyonectria sp. MPI-CAGE-AT-0026]
MVTSRPSSRPHKPSRARRPPWLRRLPWALGRPAQVAAPHFRGKHSSPLARQSVPVAPPPKSKRQVRGDDDYRGCANNHPSQTSCEPAIGDKASAKPPSIRVPRDQAPDYGSGTVRFAGLRWDMPAIIAGGLLARACPVGYAIRSGLYLPCREILATEQGDGVSY